MMPFSKKARLWIAGRKNWKKQAKDVASKYDKWIWIHCSSYGEYEDIATVIQGVRERSTHCGVVITFFSPSGAEKWKESNIADHVMYLPRDSKRNARVFLDSFDCEMVLFSRSELWFFFLQEVKNRHIPTYLVGLLMNEESAFLKWPQIVLYREVLRNFSCVYCQDQRTSDLLNVRMGMKSAKVVGNCRIDRIYKSETQEFLRIQNWLGDSNCVVAGSTHSQEDVFISRALRENVFPNVKWIIVPHEYEMKRHERLYFQSSSKGLRYSEWNTNELDVDFLMINTVGILKHLYQFATVAIVGGGFIRKGVHNVIEPTIHGVPIIIGPNDRGYPEVQQLINEGACTKISDYSSFVKAIEDGFATQKHTGSDSKKLLHSQLGATDLILTDLFALHPEIFSN